MRMNNFREAPLIRAHFLINQEKSKKGYKSIQPEISKMVETFGSEFDKSLHKNIFDEIEFKEARTLINSKNSKTQFFIQEFPQLLERSDFVSFFSEILMSTENQGTAQEIYDGLNKINKLTFENQLKILISFIFSGNDRFVSEAKNILLSKCKEIQKEGKIDQISQSTIQNLVLILGTLEENQQDSLDFINFVQESQNSNYYQDEIKQLNDIEKILEIGNDETIEVEKLYYELGPLMINNMISTTNCEMINNELDEKRLASFILVLLKHQVWIEDKENKQLNKIFLKSIENEAANKIDESGSEKKSVNWNVDNFYKMYKKCIDQMDKSQVINALDDPNFSIKEKKTFDYFIYILKQLNILKDPQEFFNFIFTKWNNELNQIEFLTFLINNSDNTYSFKNYGRKIPKPIELNNTNITYQKFGHLIDAWSTIDLYEILFKLSKGNYYMQIKELFEWPMQNIPEIIIYALTDIKPEKDEFLFYEITQEILPNFLTNHNNNFTLIEDVWGLNKELIIDTLCTMYNNQPDLMNLSKILDITQKIKDSLLTLVNCKDYYFSVNLGILAAKRDFLHLEKWLKKRVAAAGDDFIEALLNYIRINLLAHCKGNSVNKDNILEKAQLSLESLAIILENLVNEINNSKISDRIKNEIKDIYKSIFENFDKIQVQPVNPEEIENTANNLFQSMFNEEITVDDLIKKLITFQKSTVSRESEIYACMIHCVLDEYKFYHQYPEKQLKLSATLFGQIINHKLIEGIIETIALKYILEGIKKEGPMFLFGTIALSQFIDKIDIWPTFLANLMEIPQLKTNECLYEKLNEKYKESVSNNLISPIKSQNINNENNNNNNENIFNNNENSNENNNDDKRQNNINNNTNNNNQVENEKTMEVPNSLNSNVNKGTSQNTNSLNNNTLSDSNYFNNNNSLLNMNIDNKNVRTRLTKPMNLMNNITQIIDNSVDNEIPSPPQDIIDKMKIIFNTLSQCNVNDKSKELKNLLSNETNNKWFSNFFIKNRVCADINNHSIYNELIKLIDSKDLNKLLIKDTIALIKKILAKENLDKDGKEKNILKILGNWLGIMTLAKNKPIFAKDLDLKEIIFDAYEKGRLNIVISFVIRILENTRDSKVFHPKNPWIQALFSLLFEIYSKNTLKNLKNEISQFFKKLEIDINNNQIVLTKQLDKYTLCPNSPDFNNIEQPKFVEIYNKVNKLDNYITNMLSKINASQSANKNTNNKNIITRSMLCEFLAKSLNSAIKEILSPVIERAVNISVVTTRELAVKDFTFDNDENKFKNAAIYCIKSLSGSLAMVTCKEPLRINFNSQLKNHLKLKKIDEECIDSITGQPSLEIIDIGCSIIHENVIDKAIKKLQSDEKMAEEINKRKTNQNRDKEKKELIAKIKSLPKELRPKEEGLTDEQFKIYEVFDKIYESHSKIDIKNNYFYQINKLLKETTNFAKNPKNYELCMNNIQILYMESKSSFGDEDEVLVCLENPIKESKIEDPNTIIRFAQVTFKYLINASILNTSFLINIYSELIKAWASLNKEVTTEITNLLFGLDDIFIKFKQEIHYYFIKKKIFDFGLYEKYLCEYLDKEVSCTEVRKLLIYLNNSKVLSDIKFESIPSYIFDSEKSEDYFNLFSKNSKISGLIEKKSAPLLDYKMLNIKDQTAYKKYYEYCISMIYSQIFEKMINQETIPIEKIRKDISELLELPFINNDERMVIFFMLITEACIKGVIKEYFSQQRKPVLSFLTPENEAYYIIQFLNAAPSTSNKIKIFCNAISGIYKTFHYDYIKSGKNFNQRPYYKLIYNLIYYLDQNVNSENILNSDFKKINYMMMIADLLILVNPNIYPGFSLAWIDLISSYHFVRNLFEVDKNAKKSEDISKYEKYLFLIYYALDYLKASTNEIITDFNAKIFLDNIYKFMYLLCNSYPDLISSYYYIIVNSLPDGNNYIQMKNLILNCAPRDIELPDAFNEEIKDLYLNFKNKNAKVLFDTQTVCNDNETKQSINKFLETQQEGFLDDIVKKLNSFPPENSSRFHLIYGIIIYCSHNLLIEIEDGKITNECLSKLFMKFIVEFDNENRDHLINSILNELRYPCNQTFYFANLIIYLFSQIQNEEYDEHILKNLLERLMFYPRPWGIVYAFNCLLKNEKYIRLQKNYISDKNLTEVLERLIKICKNHKNCNYFSS